MMIVFPLGGTGERFRQAGYHKPKPLLQVNGQTLLEHAWSTYEALQVPHRYLYVISWQNATHELLQLIHTRHPGQCWFFEQPTRGPLETLWRSKQLFTTSEELLIADCDSFFEQPEELDAALHHFHQCRAVGGSPLQMTQDPNCSYAELKSQTPSWEIVHTIERQRLSSWSTTGPYWWQSSRQFVKAMRATLQARQYTVSPAFNWAIRTYQLITGFPVKTFVHLGSPEALQHYADRRSPPLQSQ